jgi:LacI family transcriptional regulator
MQGGLLATRHLVSLGHKRIACLGGPSGLAPSEQRIEGWRMALAEAGLAAESGRLLWHGGFTSQGGYEAMHALLRAAPLPSAVFVCNDIMAIGALRAAHESGLRVPDQISVVGFDDIELADFTSPPLTTVAQPKQRIGALAVDMLLERIDGRRRDARKVVLQPELRVRASTARYAAFVEPIAD